MDLYQVFGCSFLLCFIYGYPFFVSVFRYLSAFSSFSYIKLSHFLPETIVYKMAFVTIFVILYVRIILSIICTILAGLLIVGNKENHFIIALFNFSLYSVEGLFMVVIFLMFWGLRIAYNIGQVSSTNQILLLSNSKII